ncbi:MAG: hypothetical protein DWQ47_00960 [Acidobacteria bacterium]|nr:MAG: hypothetical protein DWQ32_11420 [Acidobacteriota bacterium]REK04073.1 MAG: hypothetical protein DWQ38_00945 [Acidobacteriota bacterium]REK15235.1 MAG: hypothetical protein DWQ43_17110 [Acidobacteriota bacterium]REK46325.1 MAG: hypothetical protein DWQ47_00960 [Acidobacteriota bacterium]
MSRYYPEKIDGLLRSSDHAGSPDSFDCAGTAASLDCGVRVRIFVSIAGEDRLESLRFVSNGCGYAVAAAEALCRWADGSKLQDLHGLALLEETVTRTLGEIPSSRRNCTALAIEAFQKALAELRDRRVAKWNGDTALICSCFGVSEETIEEIVRSGSALTVEAVGDACNAGTGCGSCQMLIGEIVESTER